jgi:hypothetical protein
MKYMYEISSRIYLDKQQQCYKRLVTINTKPEGPLKTLVKQLHHNKLSPFEAVNNCNTNCFKSCYYALRNPEIYNNGNGKYCDDLLCLNDIPSFTSFLLENGYTINTDISKMFMKNTRINPKKDLLFYIEYET